MHDKFILKQANIVSSPPNIRKGVGYLVFENWTKREVKKKLLRNWGLVEKGKVLLESGGGGGPNCFISFP